MFRSRKLYKLGLARTGVEVSDFTVSTVQQTAIGQVNGLSGNREHNTLSVADTLHYMATLYVTPLQSHIQIKNAVLCDCAAGFGWLSFAFLLSGGARAILVEPHAGKLSAARELAEILGVADRCEFRSDLLQGLDLPDKSVDVFASVETLEHVGRANIAAAVANMDRITRQAIILTAPNQLSPLVSHDARVPFSHWLPIAWRSGFCRIFGVRHREFNHFPTPWHLRRLRQRFQPQAKTLIFEDHRAWRDHYPVYSPYGGGVWKHAPPVWLSLYLRLTSALLGRHAYWICPNLANIWVARDLA